MQVRKEYICCKTKEFFVQRKFHATWSQDTGFLERAKYLLFAQLLFVHRAHIIGVPTIKLTICGILRLLEAILRQLLHQLQHIIPFFLVRANGL